MIGRLIIGTALFVGSYLGAAVALAAGSIALFLPAFCVSQAVAMAVLIHRPGTFRASLARVGWRPLAASAAPRPAVTTERARDWALSGALVDEARALGAPLCEPGAAVGDEADPDGALTFWALVDAASQSAVEIVRSRLEAESLLAEALGRHPGRRDRLSVVAIDLGAPAETAPVAAAAGQAFGRSLPGDLRPRGRG